MLDGLNPMPHRRRLYALEELRVDRRSPIPEGYQMVPLDEALFRREDLKGMDTMADWVLGDWRTAAQFAERELGFCLVHGEELVSWCATEYTCEPVPGTGRMCHLGIYTREGYRRRGFATRVATATVEHCLASGIEQVGWHCWASNEASAATARRVGFDLAAEQVVYNGCYNPFDNLLLQAHYHARANRPQEALARWERAFAMWEAQDPEAVGSPHCQANPDTVGWCYYAAARVRAGQGQQEAALSHLHRALDNGWADVERLRGDDRLAGLRGSPGWDALLARLGE